jgi:hypothetical protein
MRTEGYLAQMERYSARNYGPLPVVLARGEGALVWDVEGRRYIDLLSAYSALNHGHRHPRLIRALVDQAARLTLTSRAFHNDQLGPWCEQLAAYAGTDMVLPMNTGVEAVEAALKLARKWAYVTKAVPPDEAETIVCAGNFHGRTITVVSFSTEELYRRHFGPFTPGFRVIPYGDAAALEAAISDRTAAFLVEAIQGEAGVIVPPAGYLRAAREVCARRIDGGRCGFCGLAWLLYRGSRALRVAGRSAVIPARGGMSPASPRLCGSDVFLASGAQPQGPRKLSAAPQGHSTSPTSSPIPRASTPRRFFFPVAPCRWERRPEVALDRLGHVDPGARRQGH